MKNKPEIVKASLRETLEFDELGLVPAVVHDWITGTVLMRGFMTQEAIDLVLQLWSDPKPGLYESKYWRFTVPEPELG